MGAGVEQLTEKEERLLKLIEGMSNVGGERRGTSMSGCKMAVWRVNILLTSRWSPSLAWLEEVCVTPPPPSPPVSH